MKPASPSHRSPYRVAFLGFSEFERTSLASYLRLTIEREPRYELVYTLTDADFLVADADHAPSVQLVVVTERLAETVFIGSHAPPGAAGSMRRPIDALHVMRALDVMVQLEAEAEGGSATAPVRPAAATARPAAAPPAPRAPARPAGPESDVIVESMLRMPAPWALPASPPEAQPPAPPLPAADEPAPTLTLRLKPTPISPPSPAPAPARARARVPAQAPSPVPATAPATVPAPASTSGPAPAARRPGERSSLAHPQRPPQPSLPLGSAPPPVFVGPPPPPRALLVDDSAIALRYLASRLEPWSVRCDSVHTSAEALEQLAERAYEFVFIDVELGEDSDIDGLTLCNTIKRSELAFNAMVVMVSAHHSEIDRARGSLAGCDGYLGKPLKENELNTLLLRLGLVPPGGLAARRTAPVEAEPALPANPWQGIAR